MASNQVRWLRNLGGAQGPLIMLGLFQAGATQAIKRGELLELTGDTNTAWVPLDSDFAMAGNVAIAHEEIKDGDRAGYYEIIVPRPDDVFEFTLAAAGDPELGTPLYFSSSEVLTETAGTNIVGRVANQAHYPQKQGHLSDEPSGDAGTTIKNTLQVGVIISAKASTCRWSGQSSELRVTGSYEPDRIEFRSQKAKSPG